MGELLTQLRKDNMQAMKEKDTVKKGVLSLVISGIALYEKENHIVLSREEELGFVQKELKQTRDALAETPASRQDLIDENNAKIAILESYLPQQMTEEEIKTAILAILEENGLEPVKKSQGVVMKTMMAKYKGLTDGKTVNKVLAEILK